MKYIFISYLFNVININILHYKLSQISNNLTKKSQSGHFLRDGGSSIYAYALFFLIKTVYNGFENELVPAYVLRRA
jgi:hypothetical protein